MPLGLGRINEANQYLSQAQWSVLKATGEVDPLIKCNLHRNLGQLAVAKSRLSDAKRQFAEDVCDWCVVLCVSLALLKSPRLVSYQLLCASSSVNCTLSLLACPAGVPGKSGVQSGCSGGGRWLLPFGWSLLARE